jgi:hypothetical protein
VAHTWNPSYLGGWNREDHSSRPAWANSSRDPPHLQNNHSKMDWRCGSSSSAPALHLQSPEFKHQSYQKKPPKTTPRNGLATDKFPTYPCQHYRETCWFLYRRLIPPQSSWLWMPKFHYYLSHPHSWSQALPWLSLPPGIALLPRHRMAPINFPVFIPLYSPSGNCQFSILPDLPTGHIQHGWPWLSSILVPPACWPLFRAYSLSLNWCPGA